MKLFVSPIGNCTAIYDEVLPLKLLGKLEIQRASHVEPDHHGEWLVDLSPVSGPLLGPFSLRSQAIEAELDWLSCWINQDPGSTS